MSEETQIKGRSRVAIIAGIAAVCLITGIYFSAKLLNNRVNSFINNLAGRMSASLGNPVIIKNITTEWDWFLLKIHLHDIAVYHNENKIPFFIVKDVIVTVDTLDSLASFGLRFKNLLLDEPKLSVSWDGVGIPKIVGLGAIENNESVDLGLMVRLLGMQKHILIVNGDLHLQGRNGADLPLMDVKLEFKEKSKFEYSLLARGKIAAAVTPEFNFAMNMHGDLNNLQTAMVEFELNTSNLDVAELFEFLPKYEQKVINGTFDQFDLKGTVQNGTMRYLNSEFAINKLVIQENTVITSAKGEIELRPFKQQAKIVLEDILVKNDKLFTQQIPISKITGFVTLKADGDFYELNTEALQIELLDMSIYPEFSMAIDYDVISRLSLNAPLDGAHVNLATAILPDKIMSSGLTGWLQQALIDGEIKHINLNYTPEHKSAEVLFDNLEIKYAQDWPSLTDIKARLSIDNDHGLKIAATGAKIIGESIEDLAVNFAISQNKPYALISVDGKVHTSLEKGLEFLLKTPLKSQVATKLATFNPAGGMDLSLGVRVDVGRVDPQMSYVGSIALQDAKLSAPQFNLPLSDINGTINFAITNSTNKISAKDIRLKVFNRTATAGISLSEEQSGGLLVKLATDMSVDDLKKLLPTYDFSRLSGTTNIVANIDLPWNKYHHDKVLTVTSDLIGITSSYPEPFNKIANNKLPLQFSYYINDDTQSSAAIKLANVLDSKLFFDKNGLSGARFALNEKLTNVTRTNMIYIDGRLRNFNWNDWKSWFSIDQDDTLPVEMNVKIDKLTFNDSNFNNLKLEYNSVNHELGIESKLLTGSIQFDSGLDKFKVNLQEVNLSDSNTKSNQFLDHILLKHREKSLPLVELYAENLHFPKYNVNKLQFQLIPRPYGYQISDLAVETENFLLQAQGQWQMDDENDTQISGSAYTNNLSKALVDFGYNVSMSKGRGEFNFNLRWDGSPFACDFLKLDGTTHIDIRAGTLTEVNPGLGRVIGLLSVDSIQRRLKLDFSDVVNRGFAFDKLTADVNLKSGIASSENINLTSPSARIELAGNTDLNTRALDFNMTVIPKVGAGLPVAAAIAAGNPAVGAAIWLFDQVSGSKISEMSKYKYNVTGTWETPKITEVTDKSKKQ